MNKGFAALFLFLLLTCCCQAQLCQGSLGDPIVNITFGSGSNPGGALPAAATGYQHVSSDCPQDGQYAVRNNTTNCFTSWHSLSSDHTGNPGGYFMLVNASFQPSAFYLDTVDLFCSNTTYEFAAWVMNMMRFTVCGGQPGIQPNLTFSIERTDGTVLQTITTGNVPVNSTPLWRQYGFFFTAPPGTNRVVLRITNNAPGGCGNDLAIDDITFRPCGPLLTATAGGSSLINVCQGATQQVSFTSTLSAGFADPYFQWQQSSDNGASWTDISGANSPTLVRNITATTLPGDYLYRLSVAKAENSTVAVCRVNSTVLTIRVNPRPVITLTNNSPQCAEGTVKLTAAGAPTLSWTGPNGFAQNGGDVTFTNAQTSNSGRYYVLATSGAGCTATDSADVLVNPKPVAGINLTSADICEGEVVNLSASGGDRYQWTPAAGLSSAAVADPAAAPADSITYRVIVSNNFGCADTAVAEINVFKKPIARAGADIEMVAGQTATLNGFVAGTDVRFVWSPDFFISSVAAVQPTVNPAQDTAYVLTVSSNVGCGMTSDTVKVKVFKGIFVPTAFSPNGDGLNDLWRIPGLSLYKDHEVTVYNRYGQVVFRTRNNQGWNGNFEGKPQPAGVYVYLVRSKEARLMLKGTVMIVR